jgi:hypothetical protein
MGCSGEEDHSWNIISTNLDLNHIFSFSNAPIQIYRKLASSSFFANYILVWTLGSIDLL